MGRIFGTDGARGVAGKELTADLALNIGRASAMVLANSCKGKKPRVIIGRDTRISGTMLESAVAAGLCSVGADVVLIGVVPTPAVCYLVGKMEADCGVMISASHNPFEFNGIKLFGGDGFKLSDETENEIEEIILDKVRPYEMKTDEKIGTLYYDEKAVEEYIKFISDFYEGGYKGRILVDCANGSASRTAKQIFDSINVNADVEFMSPDGININNNCGSTHIGNLAKDVVLGGYDMGFAFDGDADRFLAVDETGKILDGDYLLAVIADHLKSEGKLKKNTVVVTTMTNLAFKKLMEKHGNHVEVTNVGDRYVLLNMRENGYSLGGEQSGHYILLDYHKTGDGQLSSVALLNAVAKSGKKLSELCSELVPYPQVMVNVKATNEMKQKLDKDENVSKIIKNWEDKFKDNGRIVVRCSGTEPLIRVMVESESKEETNKAANEIAQAITLYLK